MKDYTSITHSDESRRASVTILEFVVETRNGSNAVDPPMSISFSTNHSRRWLNYFPGFAYTDKVGFEQS
jgi:hypothetical protein